MAKELEKPVNCKRIRELCQCGHSLHGFDLGNPESTKCCENGCDCEKFAEKEIVSEKIVIDSLGMDQSNE